MRRSIVGGAVAAVCLWGGGGALAASGLTAFEVLVDAAAVTASVWTILAWRDAHPSAAQWLNALTLGAHTMHQVLTAAETSAAPTAEVTPLRETSAS